MHASENASSFRTPSPTALCPVHSAEATTRLLPSPRPESQSRLRRSLRPPAKTWATTRVASATRQPGKPSNDLRAGRTLFVGHPEGRFILANFNSVHLFAALGAIKIGLGIFDREGVQIDRVLGHGGFFKTPEVGQRIMAAAMNVPVSVMETAGEGGAWGIALLAAYTVRKGEKESLEAYLEEKVFAGAQGTTLAPDPRDVQGFNAFMDRYKKGLGIEAAAVAGLR